MFFFFFLDFFFCFLNDFFFASCFCLAASQHRLVAADGMTRPVNHSFVQKEIILFQLVLLLVLISYIRVTVCFHLCASVFFIGCMIFFILILLIFFLTLSNFTSLFRSFSQTDF